MRIRPRRGPLDHRYLHLGHSSIGGIGLFAKRKLSQGTPLTPFDGPFFFARCDEDLPVPYCGLPIQVNGQQVRSSIGFAQFVNHSCESNAGLCLLNDLYWILARRDILKGEEILWDYSMSQWPNSFIFYPPRLCRCGSALCRGDQLGAESLPKERARIYLMEGWCTRFIRAELGRLRGIW